MYRIGIDIGSTYTKYYVVCDNPASIKMTYERTPVGQRDYFANKFEELYKIHSNTSIVSCGYGRGNVVAYKSVDELTALAIGAYKMYPDFDTILDIGGQDSKLIQHSGGKLTRFFINDRCAAGSGMFLMSSLNLLGKDYDAIDLLSGSMEAPKLSSVCAVFSQSEIVRLVADNVSADDIVRGVLRHIFIQAKKLLDKVDADKVLLSGGLTNIPGVAGFCSKVLGVECIAAEQGSYLAAIGCAEIARE